jgi:hypothetical protein
MKTTEVRPVKLENLNPAFRVLVHFMRGELKDDQCANDAKTRPASPPGRNDGG